MPLHYHCQDASAVLTLLGAWLSWSWLVFELVLLPTIQHLNLSGKYFKVHPKSLQSVPLGASRLLPATAVSLGCATVEQPS
jgi:hypothetical protein